MQTDWKIDVAMVDSMGDPLHNVMHSMGTESIMGWNTVCYTGMQSPNHRPGKPDMLSQHAVA